MATIALVAPEPSIMRLAIRSSLVALATCALLAPSLWGCIGIAVGAGAAVATTATEERGLAGAASDAKILVEINHHWFQRDHMMFGKLEATVYDGRVLVTGVVEDDAVRTEAIRLTWLAPGIKEVYNEIEVVGPTNLIDYSRDVWIGTQLRTGLTLDAKVYSNNYSISVVNGAVYIIGIARSREELDAVVNRARNLSYVKRVVSHVRVKDGTA
ncbi:MAG: BON domain-containing protein [Alphaproteobacteria bacterium]